MPPTASVLIGAGQRGFFVYGRWAEEHPRELAFVAVVEPDERRRHRFGEVHGIPESRRFATLGELRANGQLTESCFVTNPDQDHHHAAAALLDAGYSIYLEKPMAATIEDSVALENRARRLGRLMHVAYVLRYTPFFEAVHEVVSSGRLGEIVTVEHRENVAAWHMAHSYVRGNWSRASVSSPMIVQKCCHDFDVMAWNLADPVRRLSSFGSLLHFRSEWAPEGATPRCTDGCPAAESCPFDAQRIYLNPRWTGWPVHVITDDLSPEGRLRALREGPYGRCVYTAASDVVDHQVVAMELASGASAVLVMHGHSPREERTMRYEGTRATLRGRFSAQSAIEVVDHLDGRVERIAVHDGEGGHGGGDDGSIRHFLAAVRQGSTSASAATAALESHFLAFAAEEARAEGMVIDMAAFRSRYRPEGPA